MPWVEIRGGRGGGGRRQVGKAGRNGRAAVAANSSCKIRPLQVRGSFPFQSSRISTPSAATTEIRIELELG